MTAKQVIDKLQQSGWVLDRINGSHHTLSMLLLDIHNILESSIYRMMSYINTFSLIFRTNLAFSN
jgi:hypothetical protein